MQALECHSSRDLECVLPSARAHTARCRSSQHAVRVYALLFPLCALAFGSVASAEAPCEAYAKWQEQAGLSGACPRPLSTESARGVALGTGARATSVSTSALAYSPAGLAVGKMYHLEGVVDYMPDLKTVALGGAVVDSSTSRLAAGLSLRGFVSGQGGFGGIDGRLGLGFPLTNSVSIGVAGRYVSATRDLPTPNVPDAANGGEMPLPAPESARKVKGFTLDASLRISPVPSVTLALLSYNLINLDSVYAPLTLGGGLGIALGSIGVLGGDVLVDLTSYEKANPTIGVGGEIFAGQAVPFRAGYSYDVKRTQHTLSVGLGYTDRSVGLDISLRQDLGGAGDTRIIGAFRAYVQ